MRYPGCRCPEGFGGLFCETDFRFAISEFCASKSGHKHFVIIISFACHNKLYMYISCDMLKLHLMLFYAVP